MALSVEKIESAGALSFKEDKDRRHWERGDGPAHIRQWILDLNQISLSVAGRGIVVVGWWSTIGAHRTLEAFDARRLSAANRADPKPYTRPQVKRIEQEAARQGLPINVVARNTPGEHWHIGPVKYVGRPL